MQGSNRNESGEGGKARAEAPAGAGPDSLVTRTLRDLRRRKVFRVMAVYGVSAWFIIQAAEATFEPLHVPDWVHTLVVVFVILGFPVALILAWLFDLTPRGVVRTPPTEHSERVNWFSRRLIDFVIIGVLAGAVVYLWYRPGVPHAPSTPVKSIAVLPFLDLSERQDQAYFGDGIAEELLNALVQIDGLRVAARTSSFAFRGQDRDIPDIGDQLNVDTVLEGSIRRSGDRVRITAQLIDTEDGYHLWSRQYDREVTDIFTVQEEITRSIVEQLQLKLTGEQEQEVVRASTGSIRAYDLYLLGRHHWRERNEDSLQKALTLFEDAVDLDPNFALAYSGLADTYLLLSEEQYGQLSPAEVRRHAEPAIARALALDSQLAESYASLGLLRWSLGESEVAELALRKAIDLNPNYSMAHMWLGGVLMERGDALRAAHEEYRRAQELDPLHPVINANLIWSLSNLGRYEEAVTRVEALQQRDPKRGQLVRAELANSFGHTDEAVRTLAQLVGAYPNDGKAQAFLALAYTELGDFEEAARWAQRAAELEPDSHMVFNVRAFLSLVRGEFDSLAALVEPRLAKIPDASADALGKSERIVLMWGGIARMGSGEPALAAALLERAVSGLEGKLLGSPEDHILAQNLLAQAYRQSEQPGRAEETIAQNLALAERMRDAGWARPGLHASIAGIYALQRREQEALAELRRAIDSGWTGYWLATTLPAFDSLRSRPQFETLMRELKASVDAMRERAAAVDIELAAR